MTIETISAWDTETTLIGPGALAPKPACLTYQIHRVADRTSDVEQIVDRHEAGSYLWSWLSDKKTLMVGQNVAFDNAVMASNTPTLLPLIIEAYDEDRITDTMIREQLLMIAGGQYKGWPDEKGRWIRPRFDLDGLARRHAGMQLDKDTWRLRYGEFIGALPRQQDLKDHLIDLGLDPEMKDVPLVHWPEGARTYPKQDAVATLAVYLSQRRSEEYLEDQYRQARAAFALHLTSAWGLMTDPAKVLKFKAATEDELVDIQDRLEEAGLVVRKEHKNGPATFHRNTKAAAARMIEVCKDEGLILRRTASWTEEHAADECIALDADSCEECGDDLLGDYAEFTTLAAMLNKDVPMLLAGCYSPIHTSFGMADTGRSTSRSNKILGKGTGNLQNLRRGAKKRKGESDEEFKARKARSGDIRECFVPRPGMVFIQSDYEQLELHTLAQVCVTLFGHSKLADTINAGKDAHSVVAALILGKSYEYVVANKKLYEVENARQTAKVANFGFPGGLGAKKLVLFARKTYGVIITEDDARALKRIWLEAYPEMEEFFNYVAQHNDGVIEQLFVKRIRGGCTFCAGCNTLFQGLGADCAKEAAWRLCKACYADEFSPLYGSRVVNFIHDEFHIETPDNENAHEAAMETKKRMEDGANIYLPDCPVHTEPLLMRYWSKAAVPVYDANKRLIPWTAAA